MDKTGPPSPASSTNNPSATSDDVLQSQLQQLIQHNASVPPTDAHSQIGSNPHSRYSSPIPQQQHLPLPSYDQGPYSTAPASTYGSGYQQQQYQMEHSPYPQLPDTASSLTPHNAYSTPATSPPTPLQRMDGMTMRSGREINNNRASGGTPGLGPQSTRVGKSSPKPRNGAGAKKGKRRKGKGSSDEPGQTLEAPLSRLVEHITNVQDTDIESYVKRSPEVRRQEVADSKDCKVKRPMNAFMLYRKAFQNRTKEWKKHDNHQIISQLCGYSWGIEDPELKARFDEWAKIERDNHKAAFPDYKFAPAKAKNKKAPTSNVRRVNSDDDDSDLDGYDWEGMSGPPSRSASRGGRRPYDPEADYRPPGRQYAPYGQHPSPMMQHHPHPRQGGYPPHQSSFQYSNPGKPQPDAYGTRLGPNQYYQQTSEYMTRPAYGHPMGGYGGMPYVENVYMNKANSPATSYHSSPIDHYGDMMGSAYPPPPQPQVAMPHAHQIDPSLMSHQAVGGVAQASQYDALGILPGLADHGDTMPSYGDIPVGGHEPQGQQQHYDPSLFQQQPPPPPTTQETSPTSVLPESTWHDDTVLPKFEDSGWDKLGEGDFRYEDMDAMLETPDSPGA
ncbi:hypothetical protein GGR53DRAFT_84010 [Hypoxylon sp. FL1150]|nr:hypothetical protein GGR53DRAFT_84010 [Hypoxylon sp. FL1150]